MGVAVAVTAVMAEAGERGKKELMDDCALAAAGDLGTDGCLCSAGRARGCCDSTSMGAGAATTVGTAAAAAAGEAAGVDVAGANPNGCMAAPPKVAVALPNTGTGKDAGASVCGATGDAAIGEAIDTSEVLRLSVRRFRLPAPPAPPGVASAGDEAAAPKGVEGTETGCT